MTRKHSIEAAVLGDLSIRYKGIPKQKLVVLLELWRGRSHWPEAAENIAAIKDELLFARD